MTGTTASNPLVVDSSGWLEYLTDSSKADLFAPYLEGETEVLVPTVVIYEVRKILILKKDDTLANIFLSSALRKTVVPFDEVLAIKASDLSTTYKLPMADSIIYATAQRYHAPLVTSDAHFSNLPGITLL